MILKMLFTNLHCKECNITLVSPVPWQPLLDMPWQQRELTMAVTVESHPDRNCFSVLKKYLRIIVCQHVYLEDKMAGSK